MINKIQNLIKAAVSVTHDDTGNFRISFSSWFGKKSQKVESLVPHGTFGKPLAGNQQLILQKLAQESNIVAFELDAKNRVVKECIPGEYGIGNTSEKSYIYFKDGGDIEILTGDTVLTLQADGKFKFVGEDAVELVSTLSDWMQAMIDAKVITGIGLQPFDPITLANMTTIKTDFDKLKT